MWRHLAQILIAVAICGLYSIFFFTKNLKASDYILVSNIIGFFFILSFIIEIKSNHFLKKENFKAFSINHTHLILRRVSLFYKKFYLWKLIIIPPLMMLFISSIPIGDRFLFTTLSVIQNFLTIYLLITLYDLFEMKGYEQHISILPAITIVIITFVRNSDISYLFFFNPFGGIANLPLLSTNPLLYLIPVLIFISLYFFNSQYIHKHWSNK